jgi:hypothetical protein
MKQIRIPNLNGFAVLNRWVLKESTASVSLPFRQRALQAQMRREVTAD